MLHHKKTSTITGLFFVILCANMLLFGVVQCSEDTSWRKMNDNVTFTVDNQETNSSVLLINELMADNSITIASPNGNSPDWIEILNTGNQTINMTGMYLTDDLTNPTRWQFPEGTTIRAGEHMLVWADSNGGDGYATFSLNANGEAIGLFASDGVTLIDSVVYTKQLQDVSYGRIPDGSSTWDYLHSATPGGPNQDPSNNGKTSVESVVVLLGLVVAVAILVILLGRINARKRQR